MQWSAEQGEGAVLWMELAPMGSAKPHQLAIHPQRWGGVAVQRKNR
ncbi:hypothetical protein SynMINOS11_01180 [Synechococcus sp. Minos11]|nr:hypothetical protein SynMINOS11_01180 [Synechococcus sp. Minos11]